MKNLIPESTGGKIYVVFIIGFSIFNTYTDVPVFSEVRAGVGEYLLFIVLTYIFLYVFPTVIIRLITSMFKWIKRKLNNSA